jgi:hypothetical protein
MGDADAGLYCVKFGAASGTGQQMLSHAIALARR